MNSFRGAILGFNVSITNFNLKQFQFPTSLSHEQILNEAVGSL